MKILSSNLGCVTNVEALDMLRERHARREVEREKKRMRNAPAYSKRMRDVDQTTKLAEAYLEKTPAGSQSIEQVASCMGFLRGEGDSAARDLKLTPAERLQVVNLAPTGAVVIHAIVDECEERLDEAGVEEIVSLSKSLLGGQQADGAAAADGGGS